MGPLQEGLPSPAMILKDWDMVIIDLKDCFFTIPLAVADREKFAFTVPFLNLQVPSEGLQKKALPQGMSDSPKIFKIMCTGLSCPLVV